MLSFYPSRESRPLKKSKLGPPDVYGQDLKQREDELTESNLKGGFKYTVSSLDSKDDRSSALFDVSSINSGDLQSSIQSMIVSKNKQELYSRDYLLKKRPATSKEYFQNIKPNVNESKVASFFQDLSGAASLNSIIQKKVLVTMRKEDVYEYLWQHMVPLDRASWFIRMNNAHHFTTEKRGRKTTDPSPEWTTILQEFVCNKFKGQQNQLIGENKGSPQAQPSNAPASCPTNGDQLQYLVQLCFKLYQDGLLDRHAFLKSLIESLEQKKSNESLLAFLPLLMLFVEELLCSQFLSRSLAELCIRKLRQLYESESLYCEEEHRSRAEEGEGRRDINPPSYYLTLKLSAILHCVVLECPLALIWLPHETKCTFPLDKLPVDITSLPILPQPDSNLSPSQIYAQLSQRVHELRERRHTAEMKWSSVGIQASSRGAAVRELVDILDNLNLFKFTDVTSRTRLSDLYRRVFHSPDTLQSLSLRDDTIIQLLCQWAVAADQVGRHRPLLVSGLIWARQRERAGQSVESLLNEFGEFEEDLMDTGSVNGPEWVTRDLFPFQQALIRFLDKIDSNPGSKHISKSGSFLLLCILFSELIQREVFSFEQYLKFLVARGDFEGINLKHSYISNLPKHNIKTPDSYKMPPPRPPIDALLDSTHLKEEATCTQSSQSSSQVESVEVVPLLKEQALHLTRSNSPKPKQKAGAPLEDEQKLPKTYHYVVHFPAPDCSDRVESQRASLLYGVGAMREYCLKVLAATKDEVIDFAGVKFDQYPSKQVLKNFSILPICLQQEVASACAANYKRNKLLSLPKLIFIVELLDLSGSVNKLIEFLFDVIVSMQEEDSMKDCHPNIESPPTRPKELQLSFRIPVVSILHAYLPSLLASAYHTSHIFERLTFVFEKVKSSDHALRSDQMRVFLFLDQLYQSCFYLQEAHKDTFGPFQKSLEHTTHCNYQLNCTDLSWDQVFRHKLDLEQHSSTDISSTVGSLCSMIHKEVVDSFSLICELYAKACNASSVDIIRDLAHILADVCSECPSLNNVFMEAIRAICAPSPKHGFKELHKHILPEKPLNHNKLIIFIAFVVFHNPLLLPNLVDSVMTAACQYHRSPDSSEHQSSALDITCLLILSILTEEGRGHLDITKQTPGGSEDWHPLRKLPLYVKRFLYVQNQQLPLASVSELLKQMVQLQEYYGGEKKTSSTSSQKKINKCLEAIVSQSWVQEKCQCEVEQLALALTEKEKDSGALPGMSGDSKLKASQVKLLANYICFKGGKQACYIREDKLQVLKILESLDLWTLRSSLIQLFVLLQLTSQQQQLMKITDMISQCAFDVFSQKQEQDYKPDSGEIDIFAISSAWLVAPLVSRLPSNVHGRILKLAGEHSKGEWWTLGAGPQASDNKEGAGTSGKQQPFLELVLACLHSGSQEELLDPLSKQVNSFLKAPAEEKQPSDPKVRSHLNASLKVRLGLVGSLLNIALQNACSEWCSILAQLICSGAVDPDHTGTQELYTTTLDMLCILYRSLGNDNSINSAPREPRKCLNDLIKQDQTTLISSKCIKELSQLIGIPKPALHMKLFTRYCDHGYNPDDLVEYSLPAWDVLEGFPHNNTLSLSHYLKFLRHEPRPLKYEEQYRLCFLHTHADKNYTPYYVALPEAPDTTPTPVQSAVPPQSVELIISTPTESPTSKKLKRISVSSAKDSKRQEQPVSLDINPQIMMSANSYEPSMTHIRPSYSQPQTLYGPGRNIAPTPTMQAYHNYQYQHQHHHQQQQQQQDKLPRGYNPDEILGLEALSSYNTVNPAQQHYSMTNQRIYTRAHMQNMHGYDPSRNQINQKILNIDSYGIQPGVNSSINQYMHPQHNLQRFATQPTNQRQKIYPVNRSRQIRSMPRMPIQNSTMGAGVQAMNQYPTNTMQYAQFDQSSYQNIPQPRQYAVQGTRQIMMPRPQPQIMPQQTNQGVNYVPD